MGVYDTYGTIQLKVGPCEMHEYQVGDVVREVEDGVYVAPEGVVVIVDGQLVATFGHITTKWGEPIENRKALGIVM